MQIDDWLKAACADAERRGLAELPPLLASLARSTVEIIDTPLHRTRGDWNSRTVETSMARGNSWPLRSHPLARLIKTNFYARSQQRR